MKFDLDIYKQLVEARKIDENTIMNPWVKLTNLDDTNDDTQKTEKLSIPRANGVAFVAGGYIYLALGQNSGGTTQTVFEYDITTDEWTKKSNFEGSARQGCGIFVLNDHAYIVGGLNSSYFDDLWMFEPFKELDTED